MIHVPLNGIFYFRINFRFNVVLPCLANFLFFFFYVYVNDCAWSKDQSILIEFLLGFVLILNDEKRQDGNN
jgi:hypothetical protein